ncbi:2-hydroxyglutaryl-CoA dehydratase [bacterium]|nr:2-hydroxyglutaryl-CoA dehydratase [bacterium]
MKYTAGLDMGSTYIKAVILSEEQSICGKAMAPTGSKLVETSELVLAEAIREAGLVRENIKYIITTGYGRHMVPFRNLQVTDLTASARGSQMLFPTTRTILDIGGQTMKATRVDDKGKVVTFRLNDKCAAGTGAFLEKTARYMGYSTADIGSLLRLSKQKVPISGVCAVFAESEVISHLSEGVPPEDIMYGAISSLTDRSVQLLTRIKAEPTYILIGGILRWDTMAKSITGQLTGTVHVPDGDLPQYVTATGAALLGHLRLHQIEKTAAVTA